jgi:hypothetical protein
MRRTLSPLPRRAAARLGLATLALSLAVTSAAATAQPSGPGTVVDGDGFEQLQGFSGILTAHIGRVMGVDKLPAAMGAPLEPGLFVTVTPERVMSFDTNVASLSAGRVTDAAVAAECRSGCPAVLYDGFLAAWLDMAVESSALGTDMAGRVVFAAHADVPAKTLLQVAYATAETRPSAPPVLALALNGGQAGVRVQPFSLIPPGGMDLPASTAALGLTVEADAGRYKVKAASAQFNRELEAADARGVAAIVDDIKRKFPSKEALVIAVGESITVGELVSLIVAVRGRYSRIVLNLGQPLQIR